MQPIEHSEKKVEEADVIFKSENEMKRTLSRLCYGDLFLIGKIWIEALKAVLVGSKFKLIPTVDADMGKSSKEPETPKKPPPMRFKDLPLYDAPHFEYKDYLANESKCKDYKEKVVHKALLPHVSEYRKKVSDIAKTACCTFRDNYRSVKSTIKGNKEDIKAYMRHPDNLLLRQGVLASGTLVGYLMGGGGGIPRRFFFTSLGALAAGALCFPKETDEYFRAACYHSAKAMIAVYNATCGKEISLRERVPCRDELPDEPKPRKSLCPVKK